MIAIILNYRDAKVQYFNVENEDGIEDEILEHAEELNLKESEYYWMSAEDFNFECLN